MEERRHQMRRASDVMLPHLLTEMDELGKDMAGLKARQEVLERGLFDQDTGENRIAKLTGEVSKLLIEFERRRANKRSLAWVVSLLGALGAFGAAVWEILRGRAA